MKTRPLNLLELKPLRNVEWEDNTDGRVDLLVPKFRNKILAQWLLPRLQKPHVRVKLDAYGSYLWTRCDGRTTISEIATDMSSTFNEPVEPLVDRIGGFVRNLVRNKFLVLEFPEPHEHPIMNNE